MEKQERIGEKQACLGSTAAPCYDAIIVQADEFVCLNDDERTMYNCPACSATELVRWFNFCPNCGVKIEFDIS